MRADPFKNDREPLPDGVHVVGSDFHLTEESSTDSIIWHSVQRYLHAGEAACRCRRTAARAHESRHERLPQNGPEGFTRWFLDQQVAKKTPMDRSVTGTAQKRVDGTQLTESRG